MVSERIAVTGVGCVSPAGQDASSTFASILQGESFGRRLDLDTRGGPVAIGAPAAELTSARLNAKAARRMDRGPMFAVVSALEAWPTRRCTTCPRSGSVWCAGRPVAASAHGSGTSRPGPTRATRR